MICLSPLGAKMLNHWHFQSNFWCAEWWTISISFPRNCQKTTSEDSKSPYKMVQDMWLAYLKRTRMTSWECELSNSESCVEKAPMLVLNFAVPILNFYFLSRNPCISVFTGPWKLGSHFWIDVINIELNNIICKHTQTLQNNFLYSPHKKHSGKCLNTRKKANYSSCNHILRSS